MRSLWEGLNTITDFKRETHSVNNISAALPDELNTSNAHFEANHNALTEIVPTTAELTPTPFLWLTCAEAH